MLNHSVINKKQGVQILLSREKKTVQKRQWIQHLLTHHTG